MTNKAFSLLLLFTLVFGGALGAAFAAGVALGKSQGPDPSQETASFRPPGGSPGGSSEAGSRFGSVQGGGRPQAAGFQRQQPGPDGTGQEGRFSSRSQEHQADPGGDPSAAGHQVIVGTVDHFQDGLVTLNTFQGQVGVRLGEDTKIQTSTEGTAADLVEGVSVRIIGRRDQDGNIQARSVTLLLEDGLEEAAEISRAGDSFTRRGGAGRPTPVTGMIDSVEDGLVIISTPDGLVKVTLLADTTIQNTTVGTEADLVEGARVRVNGEIGEAGEIVAESLIVVPGEAGGFFGRSGGPGRQ